MKLNIPDKMYDILDKHKFTIENPIIKDNQATVTLKYTFYYGYVHKIKLVSNNTIDEFILALDRYCEKDDSNAYDLADDIWDNHSHDYDNWNDLFEDTEDFYHNLNLLRIELWENCPRLDEHANYLKLIEE